MNLSGRREPKEDRMAKQATDVNSMLFSMLSEVSRPAEVIEVFYMTRDNDLLDICRKVAMLDDDERATIRTVLAQMTSLQRSA